MIAYEIAEAAGPVRQGALPMGPLPHGALPLPATRCNGSLVELEKGTGLRPVLF